HQVAGLLVGHEAGGLNLDPWFADAPNTLARVAHPAAPGDIVVEPCVAIDHDVDPSPALGRYVAGETIKMLLAVGALSEPLGERHSTSMLRVPARPGQGPGRRCEESPVLCGGEHLICSGIHAPAAGATGSVTCRRAAAAPSSLPYCRQK